MLLQGTQKQYRAYRAIALPTEHGGWSFAIEPLFLGLLLAITWQSVLLSFVVLSAFLAHQPIKIALKDRQKGLRTRRTILAERFALSYAGIAIVCFVPILLAGIPSHFWGFAVIMFMMVAVQQSYDLRSKSRELIPEVTGALALAGSASLIAVLGGWLWLDALALWLILGARTIPAILYVRSAFRQQKGKPDHIFITYLVHVLAIMGVLILTAMTMAPWLGVVAMCVLFGRAYHLLRAPINVTAKTIGFREMGYGLLTVILVAVGYWLML